jgi:hypothetical protein
MGVGVIALAMLALPSIAGMVWFTGQLILPYEVITYLEGLFKWAWIVLCALADAVWVLIRYVATQPGALACIGSSTLAGALALLWMRFALGRKAAQESPASISGAR